ncbi:MAG TPA: hypothetical protein EYG95_01705, partial [Campylobacterales bacterium]|nr:hypothetical protein [Campylobacterales bacterium]
MIKVFAWAFIYTVMLFFTACASDPKEENNMTLENTQVIQNNTPKIDKIPPQLIYHDSANIPALESGYGTFGSYQVATKSIQNSAYQANLQT